MEDLGWSVGPGYRLRRELGRGGYGQVCEAESTTTGQRVAIKRFERIFRDALDAKRVLREISILPQLPSRYVAQLIDLLPLSPATEDLYAVLQLAESDLRKVLRSDVVLDPAHVQVLLYKTLCGLKFIHSAGVIHRDLKPANILVNSDCSVLICDFGLARDSVFPQQSLPTLTKHVATRWYRAPEVILLEDNYSTPVDIWSLGCVFGELLGKLAGSRHQGPLFPGRSCYPMSPARRLGLLPAEVLEAEDQLAVTFQVLGSPASLEFLSSAEKRQYVSNFAVKSKADFTHWYPTASPQAVDLLESMLQFDPANRITVENALTHAYFQSIRTPTFEETAFCPVRLPFDSSQELSIPTLRQLLVKEVERYHPVHKARWSVDCQSKREPVRRGERSC